MGLWGVYSTVRVSHVKGNGKELGGLPLHDENAGLPSSGVPPLMVLIYAYGDINMIGTC